MPDQIDRYWILVTGDPVRLSENMKHLEYVQVNPVLFGMTADDLQLVRSDSDDDADFFWKLMDNVLAVGCGGVLNTSTQDPEKDLPSIMVEATAESQFGPGVQIDRHPGQLLILFWRESRPMYYRLMKWLTDMHFDPHMTCILKEWSTQKVWNQTVEATCKGYQFAKNPDKTVRCPRCGKSVGHMEVVERRRCPACHAWLA